MVELEESLFDYKNMDPTDKYYKDLLEKSYEKLELVKKAYKENHKESLPANWKPANPELAKVIRKEVANLVKKKLQKLHKKLQKNYDYKPVEKHKGVMDTNAYSKEKFFTDEKGSNIKMSGVRCLFLAMEKILSIDTDTNLILAEWVNRSLTDSVDAMTVL